MKHFFFLAALFLAQIATAPAWAGQKEDALNWSRLQDFSATCIKQGRGAEIMLFAAPDGMIANCQLIWSDGIKYVWQWHEGKPITERPDVSKLKR